MHREAITQKLAPPTLGHLAAAGVTGAEEEQLRFHWSSPPRRVIGFQAVLTDFAERLLRWAARHGRHDLPWQQERSAYRVWVSEVMLQQTQVATVIPYFERFMRRFPTLAALAAAHDSEVLTHWAGLGYYARARNLHRAAREVVATGACELPRDRAALEALPGLGRSTAAAVLALSHGDRHPILDGNVKRVLARHLGIDGDPTTEATRARLWAAAEAATPEREVAAYTQAIMDLGAMVCTRARPACTTCPVAGDCNAHLTGRTAELPTRRARRAQPWRESWALLIEDTAGAVWLERRPPTGIWGGLYAPPEFTSVAALEHWCRQSALPGSSTALATIEHTFTHFRLRLHPRLLALGEASGSPPAAVALPPSTRPADAAGGSASPAEVMESASGLWHHPQAGGNGVNGPGLPAPIARLLDALAQYRATEPTPTDGPPEE
ncbi:MAG TPA: A/G-specific adenine glycosylase [Gammaproteobacteria bacterium]|nr:A/G-specific adenine glycosylase [Gammaproteobacteria bacterium]